MKKNLILMLGVAAAFTALPLLAEETANDDNTPVPSQEQGKGKGKWKGKGKDEKGPFAEIGLTQEQREKLHELLKEGRAAREKLHKEMQEEMKKKLDELRQKQLEKAKSFLSDEQYQKVEEILKKRMEEAKKRLQDRPGRGPGKGSDFGPKSDLE